MKLSIAEDIREDAKNVMNLFARGVELPDGTKIRPLRHFVKMLENDPNLENILFLREYEDGAAHRAKSNVYLRRTTDRDLEFIRIGTQLTLSVDDDKNTPEDESRIHAKLITKIPPLIAFIDAEKYDYAQTPEKIKMLFHLLMSYNPENPEKVRKPDQEVFIEEVVIFGKKLFSIPDDESEITDSHGEPIFMGTTIPVKRTSNIVQTPIHREMSTNTDKTNEDNNAETEEKENKEEIPDNEEIETETESEEEGEGADPFDL